MKKSVFNIELIPALEGDALWIEYGKAGDIRRILIDGGPIGAYGDLEGKLKSLPEGDKGVELVVISHIDTDHIEGIIRTLAEKRTSWPILPKDIWFNGWKHLQECKLLGGMEGDYLSALISRRAPDAWNAAFDTKAVVVLPDEPLPVKSLKGGMKITLLSPDPGKLQELAVKWEKDVSSKGIQPGDLDAAWEKLALKKQYHLNDVLGSSDIGLDLEKQLKVDQSVANGASIAFLAEYGGKSCLFLADAHMDVVCRSIRKLIPPGRKQLKVDAVKLSHHGSRANITVELMELVDAKHYLVSTNGSKHDHPDREALEVVITGSERDPELWFNYRNEHTTPWSGGPAEGQRKFRAHYPPDGEGITLNL